MVTLIGSRNIRCIRHFGALADIEKTREGIAIKNWNSIPSSERLYKDWSIRIEQQNGILA